MDARHNIIPPYHEVLASINKEITDDPPGFVNTIFGEALDSVLKELAGDSDRAAAIVGCASLDESLAGLLLEFLVQNQDGESDLLGSDNSSAPLGSFGSRIAAAYAVGLIDRDQRDALRRLKKVRNEFAHSIDLTFGDQAIADQCEAASRLVPTENYGGQQRGPRELFVCTVAKLAGLLAMERYLIQKLGIKGSFEAACKAVVARGGDAPAAG